MTATILVRSKMLRKAFNVYEIFKWRLVLGDTSMWLGISSLSNVYYLKDVVSVYNVHKGGIIQNIRYKIGIDGMIVRLFYLFKCDIEIKDLKNNKADPIDLILKRLPLLSKDLQRYFLR